PLAPSRDDSRHHRPGCGRGRQLVSQSNRVRTNRLDVKRVNAMARDPLNDQVPSPPAQARFWNLWNMTFLAGRSLEQNNLDAESVRRADTVLQWLGALGPGSGRLLEAGCGPGWLGERLASYGAATWRRSLPARCGAG